MQFFGFLKTVFQVKFFKELQFVFEIGREWKKNGKSGKIWFKEVFKG